MCKYRFSQNLKFKKYNKKFNFSSKKVETKVCMLSDGYDVGLISLESGVLKHTQMESCYKVISKIIKGGKRLKFDAIKSNFYLRVPLTKKAVGVRMGKGKGNVNTWCFPIKKGRVIFEIKGIVSKLAYFGLRQAQFRLPFLTSIFFKSPVGRVYNSDFKNS